MPSDIGPKTAIIILNWNGWADTVECLESCLRLTDANLRIIVCDNASTDGSVGRITDWAAGLTPPPIAGTTGQGMVAPGAPKPVPFIRGDRDNPPADGFDAAPLVTLLETGGNLGFAGGNNVGLAYAQRLGAEYFWLLNNDTVAAPGALSALIARMAEDGDIGLCGSTLAFYDRPDVLQLAGGCAYYPWAGMARRIDAGGSAAAPPGRAEVEARLGFVSGASCLVSAEFLAEIGPMTEDYFLYCEEIDWTLRARGKFRMGYAPDSLVFHKAGRAAGSKGADRGRSALSAYYLWRARRMVTLRYHPYGAPVLFLVAGASALMACLSGEYAAARAIVRGMAGAPRA